MQGIETGGFVLDLSMRTLAAALAVAAVLRLMRVTSAGVRHAAWTVVLAAMLLMPLLPSVVPALPLPVAPVPAVAPPDFLAIASGPQDVVTPSIAPPRTTSAPAAVAAAPPVSVAAAETSSTSARWLPTAAVAIYAAGLLLFLGRLVHGWQRVSAMIARATGADGADGVHESSEVAVPLTAGVLRPRIILPAAWKTWPADTLAAVLAHERAHVRRRDPLVAFIARLNRAIFWFHPLAWWLERQLAVTAEHACDEAATRAIAEPRRYAEILVEMADVVRRQGGRIAWQAVGVNGAGFLSGRIDRVLRGAPARVSPAKAALTLAVSAAAILLVVACRQQVDAAPLKEDPELARRLVAQDENIKKSEAARDMTQAQADELEKTLEANPDDFDTRQQLVTYYTQSSSVAWDKKVPGLRRHALWLIEHHPEHEVRAPWLSPQYDPQGFAAAKTLWEAHLAKADASPYLVYRAALFFRPHDKPYAEQLILRGMKMDPNSTALAARVPPGVAAFNWRDELAFLYASALRGSENVWGTYNDLRTHLEWLDTPYVADVRRKLDASTDAVLLTRVGQLLSQTRAGNAEQIKDEKLQAAIAGIRKMGIGYLERAVQLDPNLDAAKRSLFRATYREEDRNDAQRGITAAKRAYYSRQDAKEGKRLAEEALNAAQSHGNDPSYAATVMEAQHLLASIALDAGDREAAVRHLQASVKVPASDEIKYMTPLSWMKPVNALLKAGERERVADFLDAFGQLIGTGSEAERLRNDAKAIREGRMPVSYQHTIYRETAPSPFKPMR